MSLPVDLDAVGALIRTVAREEMLPRFRRLEDHEIQQKGPGDLVTVVDKAVEARLTAALTDWIPESTTVGEEAVAANPATLDRLRSDAWIWIIDPLDGTRNFAAGREEFASIVALARGGVTVAGWIYLPVPDRLAVVEKGAGAFENGAPMRVGPGGSLSGFAGAFTRPRGTSPRAKAIGRLAAALDQDRRITCSGVEYIKLANDEALDLMMPHSLHPWDHAAGVLMHQEAGGVHGLIRGGGRYSPRERRGPLLLTPDRDSWREAIDVMGPDIFLF